VRIVIVGAGALGSVLGGYLALAGEEVMLIGRATHVEAIRRQGLHIEGVRGTHVVRGLRAETQGSAVEAADLLVLCAKSQDTAEALSGVAHLRGKVGMAISVQNGGRKDEQLAEVFGPEAVVGATTLVGASMPEPGRVVHTGNAGTWIGEFTGASSPRVTQVAAAFRKADLPIDVRPDIRTVIWCKLNQMVPAAAIACVTRLCLHEIYLAPELAALFVELSREVAQIAERRGIPLDDFPGFAVRMTCTAPFEEAVRSVIARGQTLVERGMTQVRISTLQDLDRGKPTEAEETIGYVIRIGRELGIAMPKVEMLYRIIRAIEGAHRARQS
jgi:2-dehydropantoate 2-reductase